MFSDTLCHSGVGHLEGGHSGRYPWGSGENPYQRDQDFYSRVKQLRAEGMPDTEIAEHFGMSTGELRANYKIAMKAEKWELMQKCVKLSEEGYSNVKIGEMLDLPDTTVGNYIRKASQPLEDKTLETAFFLKDQLEEKGGYLDVGVGVERMLGVSKDNLNSALTMLENEGYIIDSTHVVKQLGTDKDTKLKILAPPGTEWKEIEFNKDKISIPGNLTIYEDKTRTNIIFPKSINSDRIQIRYAEQGGTEKDGVIELRPGVDDISLGNSRYAQVRIAVDGTHYLKGMAMYSNDIPKGVDIIFNTNKKYGTPKMEVLKKMEINKETGKIDEDNPFGATIKAGGQHYYIDKNGKKQLSVINIVNEEGDWSEWQKKISSQMLSKQPVDTIKRQLNLTYKEKYAEYQEIMSLTNPAVKKKLLASFADSCDSDSVHLKATAFPRQASHVILPITDLKENEIYAPNYIQGEKVVLIRYPHGGIFEIPELTVNNKQSTAKKLLGNARDAVGINAKVAEKLSGADFDGDTVLVIPVNSRVNIKTAPSLRGLQGFDPKKEYPAFEGMPKVSAETKFHKQQEMGSVSNLITDMTIKGAPPDEIARAVRHSMVIIDAEKHNLDWRRSYVENDIADLKERYQGGKNRGASTIISKASGVQYVNRRKEGQYLTDPETGATKLYLTDPETGKKLYREDTKTKPVKQKTEDGNYIWVKSDKKYTQESTRMAETDDAYTLSSGTTKENLYADYANKMKALANTSRKEALSIETPKRSPTAAKTYEKEVEKLTADLNIALLNKPKERQAQIYANETVKLKKQNNPDMTKEDEKKIKTQALAAGRARYGAKKELVEISDREWEAIQANAVNSSTLKSIMDNTDLDKLKELAMPRETTSISSAKLTRLKAMYDSGIYTNKEIADAIGVPVGSVYNYAKS